MSNGTNGIQLQSVKNTEPAFHSENQVSPGMYIHLVTYFSIKIYLDSVYGDQSSAGPSITQPFNVVMIPSWDFQAVEGE